MTAPAMSARHLAWEGCWNARELGGLPTPGGAIRPGVVIRASSLHTLTPRGWSAMAAGGVRTLIDLRTDWERAREPYDAPDFAVVAVALEAGLRDDPEFDGWVRGGLLGTPLYYRRFLERWPERCAAALTAVARSEGAAVVHCSKGCDRTGLIAGLLLALIGVAPEVIAEDYALSAQRLRGPEARRLNIRDDNDAVDAVLAKHDASPRGAMLGFLRGLDAARALRDGGLSRADLRALRGRLTAPPL